MHDSERDPAPSPGTGGEPDAPAPSAGTGDEARAAVPGPAAGAGDSRAAPEARVDAATAARGRQLKARWFAALFAATGVALVAALVVWSRGPVGVVRGQAPPEAREVILIDPARGVFAPGTLEADGAFRVPIPAAAHEPLLVFHGKGESLVRSGVLTPAPEVSAPALGLWSTPIRERREEGRLRFDWAPIPQGPGYPEVRRYSLLFRFRAAGGDWSEASLLSAGPEVELPVDELRDLLRNAAPDVREVTIELRSFDPSQPEGALWVAAKREWPLPWAREAQGTD